MAARSATVKFRGMLVDLAHRLTMQEAKDLAFIYLARENLEAITTGTQAMDVITKRNKILNCVKDLRHLIESLSKIGRQDLKDIVETYLTSNKPPHDCRKDPSPDVTSTMRPGTEEDKSDVSKSTITGIVMGKRTEPGITNGSSTKKRPRIETEEERELEEAISGHCLDAEEEEELEEAVSSIKCDSTSDSSDEADLSGDESTNMDDKKFMEEARKCAKMSKDEQTKVGAVLVDPLSKRIIGVGWNRMPTGCEEKFPWTSGGNTPLIEGKHYYVVYAIRAAIFDAYKKKMDPKDSILYTTLYPSNVCAQCIREAGVKEVVYISNKFHKTPFVEASKRILTGIKCRQL